MAQSLSRHFPLLPSIPGKLSPLEAQYGNGWSCVDVAAEIIKAIKVYCPYAEDAELRVKVQENLRLCYLRCPRGGKTYQSGMSLGLHCKYMHSCGETTNGVYGFHDIQ